MKLNTNIRILIHLAAPSIAITVSLKGKVMQKRYSKLYIQHIKNLKTLNKLILTGPCLIHKILHISHICNIYLQTAIKTSVTFASPLHLGNQHSNLNIFSNNYTVHFPFKPKCKIKSILLVVSYLSSCTIKGTFTGVLI